MEKEKISAASYVLWLPSWYPEPLDPLNGDFIQRHAHAVSLHVPVEVLYVVKDPQGKITKNISVSQQKKGALTETIIHYYISPSPFPAIHKLRSFTKLKRIYKKEITRIIASRGKPTLAHVYIAYKAGLIALWLKKKWNILYAITEQWTLYLEEAGNNFNHLPAFRKEHFKKIFRNAEKVSVVSKYLGDRLKVLFNIPSYTVIPNVVNTDVFFPSGHLPQGKVRFVHISVLNYQKDPENMLKAFEIVKRTHPDFELTIIGPGWERIQPLSRAMELPVTYTGPLKQEDIAGHLRAANALLLYSRYETFGCVLIEAHACGLPTIVSDIPVIRENVKEGFNGVFAPKEDPDALARQLIYFIEHRAEFKKNEIAENARDSYSYSAVGQAFVNWYGTP